MQGPYLSIKPGAYAEAVFPMCPGRVFPGKVLTTIDLAAEGQLTATGLFPGIDAPHNARFAVRILTMPTICDCRRVRRGAPRIQRQGPDRGRAQNGADAGQQLDELPVLHSVTTMLTAIRRKYGSGARMPAAVPALQQPPGSGPHQRS